MVEKQVKVSARKFQATMTILNEKGLHTRPSTELVKCANRHKSQIRLTFQGITVNAKSLLGILMLAASHGSDITIEAVGDDAEAAIQAICELAKNKFNICY